jgi:hypothetical protein
MYLASYSFLWRYLAVPRRREEVEIGLSVGSIRHVKSYAVEAEAHLLLDGYFHSQRTWALIPFFRWNTQVVIAVTIFGASNHLIFYTVWL